MNRLAYPACWFPCPEGAQNKGGREGTNDTYYGQCPGITVEGKCCRGHAEQEQEGSGGINVNKVIDSERGEDREIKCRSLDLI